MSDLLDPVVSTIGWTLLHFVWQGLLIGLLHEGLVRAARQRSPQLRYGISVCGLIALMLSPAATFWLLTASETVTPVLVQIAASEIPAMATPTPASVSPLNALEAWLPYVVALWLLGVATLSLRFGIGLLGLRRLLQHADYNAVSEWMQEELRRLAARMGVKQRVRIALSIRVDSPLVVGWLKPVILMPLSSVTGLDHQQLRMVLAHELAHLRRHDHFINVLQAIAETLLFFHPAVYRISRSLRQEREQCCDDLAVAIDGNRLAYARLLAALEEMRQCERRQSLALGIVDQELYARVERLVAGSTPSSGQERWLPVLMIALAGLVFATRTADLEAPSLPTLFEQSATRQRVALELPVPKSRAFVPIQAPASESKETKVVSTLPQEDNERIAELSRPAAAEPTPRPSISAQPETVSARRENRSADAVETSDEPHEVAPTLVTSEKRDSAMLAVETTGGEIIHATQPVYPRKAMRRGTEGSVRLVFTIAETGTVRDIEVVESEPRGEFDRAARDTVASWKYRPFMENGVPVAKRVTQVLDFRLATTSKSRQFTSVHDCQDLTGTRLCGTAALPDTRLDIADERDR